MAALPLGNNFLRLDEKIRLSTILRGDTQFVYFSRKRHVEPSSKVITITEKKKIGIITKKKSIFIPAEDLIDITVTNKENVWHGSIRYGDHNVSRQRATRDDTWSVEVFLETLQSLIQVFVVHFVTIDNISFCHLASRFIYWSRFAVYT